METTEPQSAFTVRAVMNAFPGPLFILDADLHVHEMNAGAEVLAGPTDDVCEAHPLVRVGLAAARARQPAGAPARDVQQRGPRRP